MLSLSLLSRIRISQVDKPDRQSMSLYIHNTVIGYDSLCHYWPRLSTDYW